MIPIVTSLEEAKNFFLHNSSGKCYCENEATGEGKECDNYPDAEKFFKQ